MSWKRSVFSFSGYFDIYVFCMYSFFVFSFLDGIVSNAEIWISFDLPFTSFSSKFFETVPKVPITIGTTVTFMFSASCQRPCVYPAFRFLLFSLSSLLERKKYTRWQDFFFWSGLLVGIERSVYISKSQRILCVSFSRTDSGLYIYYLSL